MLCSGNTQHPFALPCRQLYCQLWCTFLIRDQKTAVQLGRHIAGDKGAELLPALLQPGGLNRMSPEERKRLRAKAGIDNLNDVGKLLEALPRPLVEILKVSAQIRQTTANLGATLSDRLRVNAVYALDGMAHSQSPDGTVVFVGSMKDRTQRIYLSCIMYAMRTLVWWKTTMEDLIGFVKPAAVSA